MKPPASDEAGGFCVAAGLTYNTPRKDKGDGWQDNIADQPKMHLRRRDVRLWRFNSACAAVASPCRLKTQS
jgi:hypothetical protein